MCSECSVLHGELQLLKMLGDEEIGPLIYIAFNVLC